jgi:tRNA A37 methylthiotransferase MiaB
MNISIITLGCKVNQAESAAIEGASVIAGFYRRLSRADYCIINTCTVTAAIISQGSLSGGGKSRSESDCDRLLRATKAG